MEYNDSMKDLLIIGGGINGCSTARMAASNGIEVEVWEKGDLGRGASSNSSKLIHGGLRYLQHFQKNLVAESLRERELLLKNTSDLVKRQNFLLPLCYDQRYPSWIIRSGLALYDHLADLSKEHQYQKIDVAQIKNESPEFAPFKLKGAYSYSDCVTNDVAMLMAIAVDAVRNGASIYNYREWVKFEKTSMGVRAHWKDVLHKTQGTEEFKKVLFCTGAWTDSIFQKSFQNTRSLTRESQGIHIFGSNLKIESAFILPISVSSRVFFVLPWLDGALIGTTETSPGSIENPIAQPDEINELLGYLNRFFPKNEFKPRLCFAGVRPLALESGKKSEKLSRSHKIHKLNDCVFAMVGGKYTTHRQMSWDALQILDYDVDNDLTGEILPYDDWMLASYQLYEEGECRNISDLLEKNIAFGFCKTPIDFLRRRTMLFFSKDAGLRYWNEISSFFPNCHAEEWLLYYKEFLKGSRHEVLSARP
jgi:glycerol-3-phosphate dehydrogenase